MQAWQCQPLPRVTLQPKKRSTSHGGELIGSWGFMRTGGFLLAFSPNSLQCMCILVWYFTSWARKADKTIATFKFHHICIYWEACISLLHLSQLSPASFSSTGTDWSCHIRIRWGSARFLTGNRSNQAWSLKCINVGLQASSTFCYFIFFYLMVGHLLKRKLSTLHAK